jgi:peptidyl-prolyl cis-trans isomerase C
MRGKGDFFMHRLIIAIITLCLLTASSAHWTPALAQEAEKPENVATVNGVPIPITDFEWEMRNAMAKGMAQQQPEEDQDSFRSRVLDELIERELLYQESVKAGVAVEKDSVQAQMDLLKERFPDKDVFLSALTEMNMTENDLQRHIERGMSIRKYVDEAFVQKAVVTDKAVEDFYKENPQAFTRPERVRARHILREVPSDASTEAVEKEQELLLSLRARVEKGEDFGEMAKEHSSCPSSTQNGDLGFFGRGEMVKEFEDAAFSLEPGSVSDIVKTQFGFHLIQLVEKQPEGVVPLNDIKDRLVLHLKQEKGKEAATAHLKELKDTVPIERMIN